MTPNQRANLKKLREQNRAWMDDWYGQSAGGSVIADYAAGRVTVINVDAERRERIASLESELAAAKSELAAVQERIEVAYHIFSRCLSRGLDTKPYDERTAINSRILELTYAIKDERALLPK
jgi:hypothetical protein